jgi:hypothetical protein
VNTTTGYHELARTIIMAADTFVYESNVVRLLADSFHYRRREGWKKWRKRVLRFFAGQRVKGDEYLEAAMQLIVEAKLGVCDVAAAEPF